MKNDDNLCHHINFTFQKNREKNALFGIKKIFSQHIIL